MRIAASWTGVALVWSRPLEDSARPFGVPRLPAAVAATVLSAATALPSVAQSPPRWEQHDPERPVPTVVDPGARIPSGGTAGPPSDAVVLFDGGDLARWTDASGGPAGWKVEDGYAEVVPGGGGIRTRQGFGDVQLHIEWATPSPPRGDGQDRGNSGVYLMGRYEVQVLDSYGNRTYADGQAGAIYGQHPPRVNASRPPGEWQSYDIVFRRPRFDAAGELLEPATVTAFHNGVLIHDHATLRGPTGHHEQPPYEAHADRLPIVLQDHGQPVRYRNIWVRDLER